MADRRAAAGPTGLLAALAGVGLLGLAIAKAGTGETDLAEVVVTGSRIPTTLANETQPILELDATDIARGGGDSLGLVLQTLPISASSVRSTNLNNGGDGSSRSDLRALGPKRTLVLLNGHRFPDGGIGGDDSVDIDSIPVSLIDRVEILSSGASAIYGADAVAGVVNVITKSTLDELDLNAQQSITGRGDGRISTVSLSGGHELFGGQWLMGAQFVKHDAVFDTARGYAAQPLTVGDALGGLVPTGSRTLPEGVFGVPAGNALGLPEGIYTHVAGTTGYAADDYRLRNGELYDFAPSQYLQTPVERRSVWLVGTQPLSEHLTLHVEGLFNHRTSAELLAPTPYQAGIDPSPTLADGEPGIPANNYYNPFGVDLDTVSRRFVELPPRISAQRVDMHRELAALDIVLGRWQLTPALSYSHSSAAEADAAIAGNTLVQALGPSGLDAQGNVVCGTPGANGIVPAAAIIAGCVPVDVFGGVGSITPAQIQSLATTLRDYGTNMEQIAGLDAHGPFGRAPGGELQWAAGGEYRRDTGSYRFDPARGPGAVGSGGQQDIPPVGYSAREAYLEVRAPLTREHPFAQSVDLDAGARYSDFSSFGGHFTWQAGLHWAPLPALSLRTNYARVFRAPSLSELYVTQGTGEDLEYDPCGNTPTPAQRAHCAANGVPGGAYVQDFSRTFTTIAGGNPQLRPESGYSLDSGIDFRPADHPNVHASLDFYQISLDNFIDVPGSDQILEQCADSGRSDICGLIQRAPDGSVAQVAAIPRNLGSTLVSGFDLQSGWSIPLAVGRLRLALSASYLAKHNSQLFTGTPALDQAGTYATEFGALPRWRALSHVDFEAGAWRVSWSVQGFTGYRECGGVEFQDNPFCRRVNEIAYHDLEAAYRFRTLVLRAGVNNIGDRQPPFINSGNEANTDTTTYRLLGRTFFAALSYRLE